MRLGIRLAAQPRVSSGIDVRSGGGRDGTTRRRRTRIAADRDGRLVTPGRPRSGRSARRARTSSSWMSTTRSAARPSSGASPSRSRPRSAWTDAYSSGVSHTRAPALTLAGLRRLDFCCPTAVADVPVQGRADHGGRRGRGQEGPARPGPHPRRLRRRGRRAAAADRELRGGAPGSAPRGAAAGGRRRRHATRCEKERPGRAFAIVLDDLGMELGDVVETRRAVATLPRTIACRPGTR